MPFNHLLCVAITSAIIINQQTNGKEFDYSDQQLSQSKGICRLII